MVKIDPNKPLPDHTRLRYEECYAKVFLEFYYPNKYSDLIIQDKPDLYDSINEVGIEVVEAEEAVKKETFKLWYTMPYVSECKQQKNKERMKQLGEEYTEGIQVWNRLIIYDRDVDSQPFDVAFNAVKQKLNKLNCGKYKLCRQYELFIYSELMIRKEWHEKMLKRLADISAEYELQYCYIHISTQNSLCSYGIKFNEVTVFNIEKDQRMLATKAREIVEQGENK